MLGGNEIVEICNRKKKYERGKVNSNKIEEGRRNI